MTNEKIEQLKDIITFYKNAVSETENVKHILQQFDGKQPNKKFYDALELTSNANTKQWMREYDNGLVLCNPAIVSGSFPLTRIYKKIRGIYDNTFNNGSLVQGSIILPPSGGCVLLKPEYFQE